MKKLLISFVLGLVFFMPVLAYAKLDLGQGLATKAADTAGYDKKTNSTSLAELIGTVIKSVLSFVGVIFLVLMVYAGYLWMTARGEETQIEKAQDIIRSSMIGMVVMVGAFTITAFVVPRIVSKTTGDQSTDDGNGGGLGGDNEGCCTVIDYNKPDFASDRIQIFQVPHQEQCDAMCDSGLSRDVSADIRCDFVEVPKDHCSDAMQGEPGRDDFKQNR